MFSVKYDNSLLYDFITVTQARNTEGCAMYKTVMIAKLLCFWFRKAILARPRKEIYRLKKSRRWDRVLRVLNEFPNSLPKT